MTEKKKTHILIIFIPIAALIAGVGFLLYPAVSNWLNSIEQNRAIDEYTGTVEELDDTDYESLLTEAQEYNKELLCDADRFLMTEEERQIYESLLDVSGSGIMGYVEIPEIDVRLPIYHGTGEAGLQKAVGHLEGSSLPVGGSGTHSVISGHSGMPGARLFTDLDQLKEGSVFSINVLDRSLAYEVDRITVVLPEDLSNLSIEPDGDYCTLMTCTPYGVNTHRLLVRGVRIPEAEASTEEPVKPDTEAGQGKKVSSDIILAAVVVLLIAALLIFAVWKRKRSRRKTSADRRNK